MSRTSGVELVHPAYEENIEKWNQVDDIVSGSIVVKSKGEMYLPDPEGNKNNSSLNQDSFSSPEAYTAYCNRYRQDLSNASYRYLTYLQRAMFYNFTKRTQDGMVGGVFRKPPTIDDLETNLEYLLTNVDGNGTDLDQQAKSTLTQVLRKGRGGLLVDMPMLEGPASKAQVASGEAVPRIQFYDAKNIINWRTKTIGSMCILTMIVLLEQVEKDDNQFSHECENQYRVLMLDDSGNYVQQIYDVNGEMTNEVTVMIGGKPVKEILFYFTGSESNDYKVDDSPLYDLSVVNVAHYRNSADNEESSFICGQPTLVIAPSEMFGSAQQWNEANPMGVTLGSRQGINVGAGGSAMLLQASENNLAKQNMLDKEQQALAIGADLISPSSAETAEAVRIKKGADTAVVASVANNVSDAYTQAIKACGLFLGIDSNAVYQLNTDFFLGSMTAQDRAQWAADVNMGLLPATAYYDAMRKSGELEMNNEDVKKGIEADEFGVIPEVV